MSDIAIPGSGGLGQFGRGGGNIATSLDLDSPSGKKAFAKCFGEPDAHLQDVGEAVVEVTDFLIHDYIKTEESTGELLTLFRFCVIDAAGKVYDCGSEGLLRSFKMLTFAYGMPPWPKGTKLRVKKKKLPRGFTMFFELA